MKLVGLSEMGFQPAKAHESHFANSGQDVWTWFRVGSIENKQLKVRLSTLRFLVVSRVHSACQEIVADRIFFFRSQAICWP